MRINPRILPWLALLTLALTLNPQLSTAHAQGTASTYQVPLDAGGNPASGVYDLSFALHDAASGGTQHGATLGATGVGLTDGPFTVTLAAIQGLNQKLPDELKRRDAENAALKEHLERLEQLLNLKSGGEK